MQYYESRFSNDLENELRKIGLVTQSEFAIPIKTNSDKYGFHRVDCFIASPFTAIVEIFLEPKSQNKKTVNQLTKKLKTLIETFDETVAFFFLTPESTLVDDNHQLNKAINNAQLEFESNIFMLPLPAEDEKHPAKIMAKSIAISIGDWKYDIHPDEIEETFKEMAKSIDLESLRFKNNKSAELNNMVYEPDNEELFFDVLTSIKPFLKTYDFEILEEEFRELYEEYESEHFTSSALRAGRTLEFVIYTLCRAWQVPINHFTSKMLDDLNNTFNKLTKNLVDFSYSTESEKSNKKNQLQITTVQLNKKLTNLSFEIDGLEQPEEQTDVPVNLQALLRDVKKKYGKSQKVRSSLDILLQDDGLIDKTLKMRNIAAHARTSGERELITENQVDEMMQNIKSILFTLINIAVTIQEIDSCESS